MNSTHGPSNHPAARNQLRFLVKLVGKVSILVEKHGAGGEQLGEGSAFRWKHRGKHERSNELVIHEPRSFQDRWIPLNGKFSYSEPSFRPLSRLGRCRCSRTLILFSTFSPESSHLWELNFSCMVTPIPLIRFTVF